MADLGSVDRKLEWADEHIVDLKARFADFRERQPYEIVTKPDPMTNNRLALFLQVNEPAATEILTEIALRVGDIAHNLRSALDHLAFRAVPNPPNLEAVAFPVWRKPRAPTTAQYKSLVLGKVNGSSPAVVGQLLTLEPYYGGKDEALRIVDEMDILDKHRLTIAVIGSNEAVNLNFGGMMRAMATEDWVQKTPDLWLPLRPAVRYPLKDGDILFGGLDGDAIHLQPQPRLEVVLAEPRPVEGEPVIPALTQLAQFVRGTVNLFRPLL